MLFEKGVKARDFKGTVVDPYGERTIEPEGRTVARE